MQLLAVSLDMDLVNNTCLQSVTAAGCMPLSDSAATLVLPARAVSSTATIVMVQLRFLREEEGVRTAGATSSEQAFVADVLPPVMTPLVNNRAVKIPRITPTRKTAVDILKSTRPEKGMVDRQTSIRREKEGYESVQEWGCIGNWLVKNERDYAVADRE